MYIHDCLTPTLTECSSRAVFPLYGNVQQSIKEYKGRTNIKSSIEANEAAFCINLQAGRSVRQSRVRRGKARLSKAR